MNVFVVGTGRCGTMTFAKACRHVTNYTSGHEMLGGRLTARRLKYPPQHIESDPHLAWMLGPLIERYPDAFYVHLQRSRREVVESWRRRGIRRHRGAAPLIDVIFQTISQRLDAASYRQALGLLYDAVNANVRLALRHVRSMHIWLSEAKAGFRRFWTSIAAEGDLPSALAEFNICYNAYSP